MFICDIVSVSAWGTGVPHFSKIPQLFTSHEEGIEPATHDVRDHGIRDYVQLNYIATEFPTFYLASSL